jgi:hypothetical protein
MCEEKRCMNYSTNLRGRTLDVFRKSERNACNRAGKARSNERSSRCREGCSIMK